MSDTTRARREALRTRLIDIAEEWIAEGGIARIRARPLAAEAGCAVGAIYTVFDDLTGLILAVNARTFRRLGERVGAALAAAPGATAQDRLVIMSRAYLHFAAETPFAWRALFELEMSDAAEVPAWYRRELSQLFELIEAPLRELHPGWSGERIDLMTRTLFSSVHGIVLLGLERRLSAVPMPALEEMIGLLLRTITRPAGAN